MLPEAIELNDLLKRSAEFVDFELYLSTGIENSLAEQLGLSADEVMCVVQLDDSPIKDIKDKTLILSYSGRVYPPSVDKDGEPLVDPDFKGAIEAFFKDEGIEALLNENEVLSFTCSLPSAFLGVSEGDGDSEPAEPADEPEDEGPEEEEEEPPEETEPSAGDAADFIKSLEEESEPKTEPAPEAEATDEPKEAKTEKEAEEPKEAEKPEETT